MIEIEIVIATFALLASVYAVITANNSNEIAKEATRTNIMIAQRQGIIDLHNSWNGVKNIDKEKLIEPDIVNAINTLSMTSILWNHDVVDKLIIYQSYWNSFKKLYQTIESIDDLVPGGDVQVKSLLTPEIKKAYKLMKQSNLSEVKTTKYK